MKTQDFILLSPLLILGAGAVLIMILIALKLSHRIIQLSSLLLFISAFVALNFIFGYVSSSISSLLLLDGFAIFMLGLTIFSSLIVNILSYIYLEDKEESPKEYYVLLLLAALGSCILSASVHFITFFLGLELLSVALYALIAYMRARHHPVEAGLKYLVLAAFSSAFLLFGMALVYLQTGSMSFAAFGSLLSSSAPDPLALTGIGLITIGIGFKLALVPFHMWAADVYQGASAPITAFIATASKGGVLAVMIRFFVTVEGLSIPSVTAVFTVIAIASMLVGNFLALRQRNLKRILAYSSIAHFGYLLVAFIASNTASIHAICFYITTYFLSILTAFGIVTVLSSADDEAESLEAYRGLFWQKPLLAVLLMLSLLSLAGLPLTVGFIGKFYVLAVGLRSDFWLGGLVLVLSSLVGLYYYLRVTSEMFLPGEKAGVPEKKPHPAFLFFCKLTLSLLGITILALGLYPALLLNLIDRVLKY
jgi:NADH-quinone oxidoreductase subunit N